MITARVVFALLTALIAGIICRKITSDPAVLSFCLTTSFALGLFFFPFGPRRS